MNAIIGICGIAMLGWAGPDFMEPISPVPEKPSTQPSYSQHAYHQTSGIRPAQPMNTGSGHRPKMPFAPTDPRTLAGEDFPLPPTMNGDGRSPNPVRAGPELRFRPADLARNGSHHTSNQKPFAQYNSGPTTSPYALLNASTADGTVSTYINYVRPAQDQERANQELDQAAGASEEQVAPSYPRVFQNYGAYYPGYTTGR